MRPWWDRDWLMRCRSGDDSNGASRGSMIVASSVQLQLRGRGEACWEEFARGRHCPSHMAVGARRR